MVIDRCKPLNPGEQDTVRIVMNIDEAVRLLARGLDDYAHEVLVERLGVETVVRVLLSCDSGLDMGEVVEHSGLSWAQVNDALCALVKSGDIEHYDSPVPRVSYRPKGDWEVERRLPVYRAGPYDQRCRESVDGRRCVRIWDHRERGLDCDVDPGRT